MVRGFSPEVFHSFSPYFDKSTNRLFQKGTPHIWGCRALRLIEQLSGFSTGRVTYPQFMPFYPQAGSFAGLFDRLP
jgi:hypothetical protein